MPYQFIHYDGYGREGSTQTKTVTKKNGDKITTTKKVRSLREILEEQQRVEEACPHIAEPRKPGVLFGVPPLEVLKIAEDWAETATDARGHKLRKDGNVCLVGVISLPREMEDDFPKFAEESLIFLKEKYGDRLKSVIVHDDEAHPHLHFSVVPRVGERFDDIHEGIKAKNQAKKEGQKAGAQNIAYIEAMRNFQDNFSEKVAMKYGLTRLGPARRRLSRGEWKAEQAQAKFFADAKAVAKQYMKKGYKAGIAKAENKANEIIKLAEKNAQSLGSKIGSVMTGVLSAWHKPSIEVTEELEQIKKSAEKEKKKAEDYKKQAKEWADKRVANVSNQITEQKAKTEELNKELDKEREKVQDLADTLKWYEKKFGKTPDSFQKYKK